MSQAPKSLRAAAEAVLDAVEGARSDIEELRDQANIAIEALNRLYYIDLGPEVPEIEEPAQLDLVEAGARECLECDLPER
jgi:hypothetical protein